MALTTILRPGSKGTEVERWQQFLIGRGLLKGRADGDFGPITEKASKAFQKNNGLVADGIIGPRSYGHALLLGFDPELKDSVTPKDTHILTGKTPFNALSAARRQKLFGTIEYNHTPTSRNREAITITNGWDKENITTVTIPQLKGVAVFGTPSSGKLRFHKKAAEQLKAMWAAWERAGLLELVLTYEGSYNPRLIRGGTSLSNHAYGILESDQLAVQPSESYDLRAWLRGEIDVEDSIGRWILRAQFYDANHSYLSYTNVDLGDTVPSSWTEKGGAFTTPANAAYVEVQVHYYMNTGWLAMDDVSLTGPEVTTRKYFYADGTRVAMRENGELHWLFGDHLGSTSITADGSSGAKEGELRYKAYGENRYAWGETPTERRYTGQIEEQNKQMQFLVGAFFSGLGLIMLILVFQFGGISKPAIIMTAIFLSFIGVFGGLILTGWPFVIMMTMMGIIALAGIVVNNGVVLLDYTQILIDRKKVALGLGERDLLPLKEVTEIIVKGGKARLRPVLLTAITTVLGLVPLAIGLNIDFFGLFANFDPGIYIGGDNVIFWGPLAWTVIFGLIVATFLTLIIVPVLFNITYRIKLAFRGRKPAARPEARRLHQEAA